MKSKGFLLATAATGAALAPGAMAADMRAPVKVVTPPPAASWAGWYIGLHAGANWQQGNASSSAAAYGLSTKTDATGFIGGGQIGINWQRGNFVFGLEADGSWLSGKANAGPGFYAAASQVRWLATVRPRFGLAVNDTMVYTTAGVAFGGVRNSLTVDNGLLGTKSESKTRVGWTVGGGVEHMWSRNWTIALEGLFVDLGRSSVTTPNSSKVTKFSNQVVIGRFKMNYKW